MTIKMESEEEQLIEYLSELLNVDNLMVVALAVRELGESSLYELLEMKRKHYEDVDTRQV